MSKPKHYSIQKDKDIPKSVRCFGNFCPFADMEPGDSLTFSITDEKRVRLLADAYGKKHDQAFAIAYGEDDGTVRRVK